MRILLFIGKYHGPMQLGQTQNPIQDLFAEGMEILTKFYHQIVRLERISYSQVYMGELLLIKRRDSVPKRTTRKLT